jgi:hypothetical protein
MKLLSDRKKLADEGKLPMCMAEYNGSWLPYEQPLDEVTYEWLLEELTYDDCSRKDKIVEYLVQKMKQMEAEIYKYHDLKEHLKSVFSYVSEKS